MGIEADSKIEEEVQTPREWLEDRRKIGMSRGLEVTYAMLTRLGMPQMAFPCVHVAGTNGKGTTCVYLANTLSLSGKKTGLFTSPHLCRVEERIRIDGRPINSEQLDKAIHAIRVMSLQEPVLHPTYFETLFLAAMICFKAASVQRAVIETGLGGRLDATNVIENPILTIITSISIDHSDFLGDKLTSIAKEKAGIIKKGITCITAPQSQAVEKILINKCKEKNAKLIICNEKSLFTIKKNGFEINIPGNENYFFSKPSLEGPHQVINAVLAVTALTSVPELGININDINKGIKSTYWPGRLEKISTEIVKKHSLKTNDIWLDGGHNIAGAEAIKNWILYRNIKNLILVCGFLKNKDAKNILLILKDYIKHIILVPIDNKNSYTLKELKIISDDLELSSYTKDSIKEALTSSVINSSSKVLVFGSLYLIGETLKLDNN